MIPSFIARILKLGFFALLIPVVYLFAQRTYFPAPRFTANIAVNEKLAFIRNNVPEKLDVLAVGSSMTLNNLNSEAVMQHFGNIAYLNAGAWGTGASEVHLLGTLLAKKYRPKTVLVATNMMDFRRQENVLAEDSSCIATFVNGRAIWLSYLSHWNAPYYLRNSESNKLRLTDQANYEYLGFDAHGGATLIFPPERIDQNRFNAGPPKAEEMDEERYADFAQFAKDLRAMDIDLVVLECAYRDGMRTAEIDQRHAAHVERLRTMLQLHGHTIIDANQRRWDDALYVDSSHLSAEGSKEFTRWCLGRLGAVN